ncbi:hypothetical protein QOZ80_6BG0493850 [Eleusine coracana subsp. coracana]|nr:hypothetical protein QOZ80_6BG0493850 [Eleusine coracana subsp. coracana]
MVLEHGSEEPAYSIVEVAAGAVARPLSHVCAGMSFAAVRTRYGPRMVGVGVALTTVYDPKTATEVMGPRLVYPKLNPVLIPHGGKLYALAPARSAMAARSAPGGTSCHHRLSSHAASTRWSTAETQQDKGTCAFDMNAKQWEMVDDKNLPFIGQAVSLGSRRFIVRSRAKGGAATVYYMDVFLSRNTNTGKTELSIVEVPVASKGIVPGQLLCSMGKDSFTSFDIQSLDPSPEAKPDRARIVYRTYSMVSGDDGETSSVVKEQRQIFKIRGRFTRLAQPFPVAAVLTMEEESI